MAKLYYELDPFNRLIETKIGRRAAIIGMRRVLEGNFALGNNGTLVYRLKDPQPEGKGSSKREIRLNARIIDTKADSLTFSVAVKDDNGNTSLSLLTLDGAWAADTRNRLTFAVRRGERSTDPLVFEGAWEVDKKYRLVYRSTKHSFALEGQWEIADKTRLSYAFEAGANSRLDFKASLARFEGRLIKYEVGIAVASRKKPLVRTIAFTGKWQVTKGLGLVFEASVPGSTRQTFAFGCQVKLTEDDTLMCSLRNSNGRSLGIEVELERQILKGDGKVFLRALEEDGKASVTIGAGWKW